MLNIQPKYVKARHWLGLKQEVAENLNQYLALANSPKIL